MSADRDGTTTGFLTRDWTLTQRARGHRHSTDDLLTGWYAALAVPEAERVLDLGSGIGSVGLLVLWRCPRAHVVAVEAQEQSFRLLQRNVADNGLGSRFRAVHADLRDFDPAGRAFDLVTGSPPYFGPTEGVVPADPQKAHARFELKGDVGDYARAARRALAVRGRFVFCFPSARRARAEAAVRDAGLALVRARQVVPREGAPPLFDLFCCRRADEPGDDALLEPPYVVRDAAGDPTPEHLATRAAFGMPREPGPAGP